MNIRCSLLLFILTLLFVQESRAQAGTWYAGVKGGVAVPNLTARGAGDNPLNTGYRSRLGPNVALFGERIVTPAFSVVAQVEYASEGGKKTGFQPFPFPVEYAGFFPPGEVPTYLYATFSNEIQLDYLMASVLAKFNRSLHETSPWMLYAEVGPFGAYLLSAKAVTGGSSVIYADEQKQQPLIASAISFDNVMDVKDDVRRGNVGLAGDVGLAYQFNNSRVFAEAGGNYGFLNIQKDPANGKNQIGAVFVRVGYALRLGARY